jgi:uncharacterized protein with PIN domain
MTTQTISKPARKVYLTTVRCMQCGEPVEAVTEGEQRMIEQWPRDGFWLCEKCRRPVTRGRDG